MWWEKAEERETERGKQKEGREVAEANRGQTSSGDKKK